MIEPNIVNWVDLGDSMQSMDSYSKKRWVYTFNIIKIMSNYRSNSVFFLIFVQILFFLQIMILSIINIEDDDDMIINIMKYLSNLIFIPDIINTKSKYIGVFICYITWTAVLIACLIYLIISSKFEKISFTFPIKLLNFLNEIFMKFLFGPFLMISWCAIKCEDNTHIFLQTECYRDTQHLGMFCLSIVFLLFYLIYAAWLSVYYNEIGGIKHSKAYIRINCNYEMYASISTVLMFVFAFIVRYYTVDVSNSKAFREIYEIFLILISLAMTIYQMKTVWFYNVLLNNCVLYLWTFITWFCFIVSLKDILKLHNTSWFILLGWVLWAIIIYFFEDYRQEYFLTDFHIFEAKFIKEVEMFSYHLLRLLNKPDIKSQTLLIGIITKFEEYVRKCPELVDKYTKWSTNARLLKKYSNGWMFKIYCIIYLVYDFYLDKSLLKNDILWMFCYFLLNKFKNHVLAISLCSKIKMSTHKQMFLKYMLMEEIKEYLISKIVKSNNKESIKHVQIGTVILYNTYLDLFKIRIYDAACNQIDYFEILKNNNTTTKATKSILRIGDDILKLRKDILSWWDKILLLNPFSDECQKDYMWYLETIIQDEQLAKSEEKRYNSFKSAKLSERNNVYHLMFVRETSSILLVDGYGSNGKILYTSPNFPPLFNFTGKEVLNLSIEDLLPNVIATFHKELVNDAVKYSNWNVIFTKHQELFLKGKSGGWFNVEAFVKTIPNLSYGLIYIVIIKKVPDNNFLIVLDKDFHINGFTDVLSQGGVSYTINNNYGWTHSLCGQHISIILPDILLQLEYKEQRFFLVKGDIDWKGTLYPTSVIKDFQTRIESVLDKIKQIGKWQSDEEQKTEAMHEYEDLVREISTKYSKPFSVFYKIIRRTFLNERYVYYRLYITNDLLGLNEITGLNTNIRSWGGIHSGFGSIIGNGDNNSNNTKNDLIFSKYNENDVKNDMTTKIQKQIKIRINDKDKDKDKDENESKGWLDKRKKDTQYTKNAGDNNRTSKNNNNNNNNKKLESLSKANFALSPNNSILSKNSIDISSFNKLKASVLKNKEILTVKIMKLISLWFAIATIILICMNSVTAVTRINKINSYWTENLFFNNSKIIVSCIYFTSWNLKMIRLDYIKENECNSVRCSDFYRFQFNYCINSLKTQTENISYYDNDYKDIFKHDKNITWFVHDEDTTDVITIDVSNLLNLLLSNGIRLVANVRSYVDPEQTTAVINANNVILQSYNYVNEENVTGWNAHQIVTSIYSARFSNRYVICVSNVLLFIVWLFAFVCLIYKFYNVERNYWSRWIRFNCPSFDWYLKRWEEWKRKLRNDTGDDDDKINDDKDNESGEGSNDKDGNEDMNNPKNNAKGNDNRFGSMIESDNNNNNNNNNKNNKNDKEHNESKNSKNKKNKIRAKITKIQQQKKEKINAMVKYFLNVNLIFTLKAGLILLFAMSYYLIFSVIESKEKGNWWNYQRIFNDAIGIFRTSNDIYMLLKREIELYTLFDYLKQKGLAAFKSGAQSFKIFDIVYTDEETLSNAKYTIVIPSSEKVTIPKIGNLIMPWISEKGKVYQDLNQLYNGDSCQWVYGSDPNYLEFCKIFWSSILVKGLEQALTQMGVVLNSIWDELELVNSGLLTVTQLLSKEASLGECEYFVNYFLMSGYMKTRELFDIIRVDKMDEIKWIFNIIFICYSVGVLTLFLILIYLTYSVKKVFTSFLNFIVILPTQYLVEDEHFYQDILQLNQDWYE